MAAAQLRALGPAACRASTSAARRGACTFPLDRRGACTFPLVPAVSSIQVYSVGAPDREGRWLTVRAEGRDAAAAYAAARAKLGFTPTLVVHFAEGVDPAVDHHNIRAVKATTPGDETVPVAGCSVQAFAQSTGPRRAAVVLAHLPGTRVTPFTVDAANIKSTAGDGSLTDAMRSWPHCFVASAPPQNLADKAGMMHLRTQLDRVNLCGVFAECVAHGHADEEDEQPTDPPPEPIPSLVLDGETRASGAVGFLLTGEPGQGVRVMDKAEFHKLARALTAGDRFYGLTFSQAVNEEMFIPGEEAFWQSTDVADVIEVDDETLNGAETLAPPAARAALQPANMPKRLRLFPLAHVSLLPGQVTKLHIFENRYRILIKDLVEGKDCDGWFGIIGNDGVGTFVRLLARRIFPDGQSFIAIVAGRRFRTSTKDTRIRLNSFGLLEAAVEPVEDKLPRAEGSDEERDQRVLASEALDLALSYVESQREKGWGFRAQRLKDASKAGPTALSYELASVVEFFGDRKEEEDIKSFMRRMSKEEDETRRSWLVSTCTTERLSSQVLWLKKAIDWVA